MKKLRLVGAPPAIENGQVDNLRYPPRRLTGRELRALRRLQREQSPPSAFVFTSERGSPFSTAGFYKLVARAGAMASLGIKVHPHMLRHATGFDLANRGTDTRTLQDYLGHRNIQHTVRYTELAPHRFKDLWSD